MNLLNNDLKTLKASHKTKGSIIRNRLDEFRAVIKKNDKHVFQELCFCILTPQSNAVLCDEALKGLVRSGTLFSGGRDAVRRALKRVRFYNNKTEYLLKARQLFKKGLRFNIKNRIDESDVFQTREWFVKNIKGLGYKEASHFLRNIGLGNNIAILDVHILRNLKKFGVIKEIPKSISRLKYMEIETKMKVFSKRIKIPIDELDLLFWSNQTGFVFK